MYTPSAKFRRLGSESFVKGVLCLVYLLPPPPNSGTPFGVKMQLMDVILRLEAPSLLLMYPIRWGRCTRDSVCPPKMSTLLPKNHDISVSPPISRCCYPPLEGRENSRRITLEISPPKAVYGLLSSYRRSSTSRKAGIDQGCFASFHKPS